MDCKTDGKTKEFYKQGALGNTTSFRNSVYNISENHDSCYMQNRIMIRGRCRMWWKIVRGFPFSFWTSQEHWENRKPVVINTFLLLTILPFFTIWISVSSTCNCLKDHLKNLMWCFYIVHVSIEKTNRQRSI